MIRQMFGVSTPMRDGISLVSDIYIPGGGGRYPVVLLRTPYQKNQDDSERQGIIVRLAHAWAAQGIGFVNQDVRGRGDSAGQFKVFFNEADDGYDTIEWIAKQPWSNGQVAMFGGSYKGTVQWLAARGRPPHLTCLFSQAPAADFFNEAPYMGGAFLSRWTLVWPNLVSGRLNQTVPASLTDWSAVMNHRPLMTRDLEMGRELPMVREFLQHPTKDAWWMRIHFTDDDYVRITVPAFHVSGWFDQDLPGMLAHWHGMRSKSPARGSQYALIGPWNHRETRSGGDDDWIDGYDRGAKARMDIDALALRWFKSCFAGTTENFDHPRARVFVTGVNHWLDLDDYPARETVTRRFYLHSKGDANSSRGAGILSQQIPRSEPPDSYTYDPRAVAPRLPGIGAFQAISEQRDDVLTYRTDALTEPLAVLGPVTLNLNAATSALDTDFIATLNDVDPIGNLRRVVSRLAVLRARYRKGFDQQVMMQPGVPDQLTLRFYDVGHVFQPGHRLELLLTSSTEDIAPNQNTGSDVGTDTEWKTARQTVFHDPRHPSNIELSTISYQLVDRADRRGDGP